MMPKDSKGSRPTHRKALFAVLALAAVLAAMGLFAWQSKPVPEAGASVSSTEGKTREQIQRELDQTVRENMMTISVAPVAQIQEDGTLRVNVKNAKDNRFPQRFCVVQNDKTIYESGTIDPGKTVEFCPAEGIQEGEAFIEIQALNKKTLDNHGNPTRVKIQVANATS